jgi:uncharacterized SAM-binding protein YcdF (DUF218 family)
LVAHAVSKYDFGPLRTLPTNRSDLASNGFSAIIGKSISSVGHLSERRLALFGLLVRKQRWSLSWRGAIVILIVAVSLAVSTFLGLYPFLAITQRVDTKILVVEGWVHKYAIRSAVDEFRRGSYQQIFTTGGPVVGNGGYVNDYQTSASVGADLLKKFEVPSELVQMVPSHVIGRDRTYSSALALRDWLEDHAISVGSFNVLTEDFHARRTRLLYQRAFGKGVSIGIIAVPSPDYDANHWWRYSDGVREAVGESIAYLYARLVFFASESAQSEKASRSSQAYR